MFNALVAGFLASFGLIMAIGAQNAFVLRQGLRQQHVGLVVLICALSDAALIIAGVGGFSSIAQRVPWLTPVMLWGGVVFLLAYGALRFRAALKGGEALVAANNTPQSRRSVILTVLALTWLNPHVYVDTLALLGALSAQYAPFQWGFGIGAVSASFTFFIVLGYGARKLAPVLARPRAWTVLEIVIGLLMWAIAASLAAQALYGDMP